MKSFISRSIILGIISSLLWSTVFVAGRYLCDVLNIHPILVAFLRFAMAGIVSVAYIIIKGESRSLLVIAKKPLLIILLSATGIFGMGSSVFLALSRSTAVDVSIIMNSNAIFITPLAAIIGERIRLRNIAGVIIGLIGCAIVINGGVTGFQIINTENIFGNLIAAVAAICWAVYTVMGKRLVREYGGLAITSLNMTVGSIPLLLLVTGIGELALPPAKAMIVIAYLAVFPTAIGFALWYKALEKIDAVRLGPLQYIVPVGTAIISLFTLDEQIKITSIAGMLLVFVGIYLSSMSEENS